jgi:hypothetical protein
VFLILKVHFPCLGPRSRRIEIRNPAVQDSADNLVITWRIVNGPRICKIISIQHLFWKQQLRIGGSANKRRRCISDWIEINCVRILLSVQSNSHIINDLSININAKSNLKTNYINNSQIGEPTLLLWASGSSHKFGFCLSIGFAVCFERQLSPNRPALHPCSPLPQDTMEAIVGQTRRGANSKTRKPLHWNGNRPCPHDM